MASIKAGKMLQSLTALIQIHCAGDSTANINLTKSRILTSSDYYLLQNLQSCDSVYTLQMPAFLLEFERSELLQLRFSKNKQESFLPINHAKKVDEEVNTQVEVDDDEQNSSSDSEVSDEDVGMDIGDVVQSIE